MNHTTDLKNNHVPKIVALIPCLNEEKAIGDVIKDLKSELPDIEIIVFDNNSTDHTAEVARQHGAQVILSPVRGKGNVVRHMFSVIDADFYLLLDGDMTYPAKEAPKLITAAIDEKIDMVVGQRLKRFKSNSFPLFHEFGNHVISLTVNKLFGVNVTDILSGYRVMSREFVKSIPLLSQGFEIETELTLQACIKQFAIKEIPISYLERASGSESKLRTFHDGFRILKTIFFIFRFYKPMQFFSIICALFFCLSLTAGYFPIMDYIKHQMVYHVPLALLAAALMILAVISLSTGIILSTVLRYHQENFVLWKKILK